MDTALLGDDACLHLLHQEADVILSAHIVSVSRKSPDREATPCSTPSLDTFHTENPEQTEGMNAEVEECGS